MAPATRGFDTLKEAREVADEFRARKIMVGEIRQHPNERYYFWVANLYVIGDRYRADEVLELVRRGIVR